MEFRRWQPIEEFKAEAAARLERAAERCQEAAFEKGRRAAKSLSWCIACLLLLALPGIGALLLQFGLEAAGVGSIPVIVLIPIWLWARWRARRNAPRWAQRIKASRARS